MNDPNEINSIKYPGAPNRPEFDTIQNWPATTQVTQNTGEDITRNRDALLVLQRLLGPNPHIGLFTSDLRTASVAQRLSVLEQGVSEGRFEFKKLKVERAIDTIRDVNETITLVLGAARTAAHEYTKTVVKGPIHILDSGIDDPRMQLDVGLFIDRDNKSTECEIRGGSSKGKPLLLIDDRNRAEINDRNHTALEIRGNLFVSGYIDGEFALDHNRLNNINTDPVIDALGNVLVDAIHVSRGNAHSHKRGRYDERSARWIVDPNPQEATYGIINHNDLEPQSTRTSVRQRNFIPDPNIAYHVTGGDGHDHVGGDGAPLRHKFFLGVDPKNSNHVTGGDFHRHDPNKEDGGLIPTHGIVLEKGLEQSIKDLSTDPQGDPILSEETLSSLLVRVNNRFIVNDKKNRDQDERLEIQQAEIEDAKLTRQEFNRVRADANNAVATATQVESDLQITNESVQQNTQTILRFLEQSATLLFGTTVFNLDVGQQVFGLGGGGGASGEIVSFDADIDVTNSNPPPDSSALNGSLTFNSAEIRANLAATPQQGSTIVPRSGILKLFAIRATEDLPIDAQISVTIFKNFEPTQFTLIATHQDTLSGELPTPLRDTTGEVEVEAGDFITFRFRNDGTVNLEDIGIAASVGFQNPPITLDPILEIE